MTVIYRSLSCVSDWSPGHEARARVSPTLFSEWGGHGHKTIRRGPVWKAWSERRCQGVAFPNIRGRAQPWFCVVPGWLFPTAKPVDLAASMKALSWAKSIPSGRAPQCPNCGDHPPIKELIDYDPFCGIQPGRNSTQLRKSSRVNSDKSRAGGAIGWRAGDPSPAAFRQPERR